MLFSSSMKILVTASSFPADSKDWRAVFRRQLVDALGRRPELDLTLWAPPGETGPGVRHDLQGDDATWLASLMADGGIAHLLRTQPVKGIRTGIGLLRRLRAAYRRNGQTDLYHVNWLQNALALPHDGKPLLVTVLGSDLALLRLPPVRMAARRLLDKRPAVVCPNAAWMLEPLRALLGSKADIREVPFGIDAYWYQISRLPSSGAPQRWLAVTRLTRGKLGTLFEWAAPCFSDGRRELHLFGPMQEEVKVPAWVHYHGPATPQQLREQFPHAAGLVTLSQHAEGRPQVILEAMAAGLPIIASNIAAHASFLRHRETAWLCQDERQVREGFDWLENQATNTRVGKAAHRWVRDTVGTWDDCAQRYHMLYRQLLEAASHG